MTEKEKRKQRKYKNDTVPSLHPSDRQIPQQEISLQHESKDTHNGGSNGGNAAGDTGSAAFEHDGGRLG